MRQVANAIKQCPEQMKYQIKRDKLYAGPPTNVEWDVIPSKTVATIRYIATIPIFSGSNRRFRLATASSCSGSKSAGFVNVMPLVAV